MPLPIFKRKFRYWTEKYVKTRRQLSEESSNWGIAKLRWLSMYDEVLDGSNLLPCGVT